MQTNNSPKTIMASETGLCFFTDPASKPDIAKQLSVELLEYLGNKGFIMLCCAAAVKGFKQNTLWYFGSRLGYSEAEIAKALMLINELPWPKQEMPDYIRLDLVRRIPDRYLKAVKECLFEIGGSNHPYRMHINKPSTIRKWVGKVFYYICREDDPILMDRIFISVIGREIS